MTSPAYSSFCSSGHLVESVNEGSFVEPVKICPYCGSSLFHTILHWHDREPETCLVSTTPIKYEWVDVNNDHIIGKVKVAIYDMSKVDSWVSYHRIVYKTVEIENKKEEVKKEL